MKTKTKYLICIFFALITTFLMSTTALAASKYSIGQIEYINGYYHVPLYLETNKVDHLSAYSLNLYFDDTKYAIYSERENEGFVDNLTYTTSGPLGESTAKCGTLLVNYVEEEHKLNIGWFISSTEYPVFDTDGGNKMDKKLLCTLVFKTLTQSDVGSGPVTPDIFDLESTSVTSRKLNAEGEYERAETEENMNFFQLDITGNFDGKEITELYASVNGADVQNYQPLKNYFSTTLTEGSTDYSKATTSFIVNVKNPTATGEKINITIYGKDRDGNYIALGDYDQNDFFAGSSIK